MPARYTEAGVGTQPIQGGADSEAQFGDSIALGDRASSQAPGAVAIGTDATATGDSSVAIGQSSQVAKAAAFAFGDRDVLLDPNREIQPPEDGSDVSLANIASTSSAASGDLVGYTFDVGGQTVMSVRADADGSGGVTNPRAVVPTDLTVGGTTVATDTSVTGVVDVQDGANTTQYLLDATSSPPTADFGGNGLSNVGEAGVASLSGDIVPRSAPVDNIAGNIYVTEVGAADPTQNDNDIWIEIDTTA